MKTNTRHWACITAGILSLAGYASADSVGNEKYVYDASGNMIEVSSDGRVTKISYDKSNRVTNQQTNGQKLTAISYDSAGRPTAEKDDAGLEVRCMKYGYGDKVIETNRQDSKSGFFYNADGRLVGKEADGKVVTYTWDGNVLAADSNKAFTNEDHITGGVPILGAGDLVVVSDYLGNTLTSGRDQFSPTAFGEGLEAARFTGKPYVRELQGYLFTARLYSSELKRWTIADPSGFPDGLNNLLYLGGDPIGNVDPTGTTIYHGPQTDYKSCDANENKNPPYGATTLVSYQLESAYNTHAAITDVSASGTAVSGTADFLTTASKPYAAADPVIEYYAPTVTNITHTKYSVVVGAKIGAIQLWGYNFNEHTVWIEQ